jgi:hypothetical protein
MTNVSLSAMQLRGHSRRVAPVSLAAILVLASGCAQQTYSGNVKPTSFRVMPLNVDSNERNKWKQSLFITPFAVVKRCGQPIREWETNSDLANSQYAITQKHLIYGKENVEILISRYSNARKTPDRNWFYSGIFPIQNKLGYGRDRALKLMPCLADKIVAWSAPPASVTQIK